jgi:hypothetical protein
MTFLTPVEPDHVMPLIYQDNFDRSFFPFGENFMLENSLKRKKLIPKLLLKSMTNTCAFRHTLSGSCLLSKQPWAVVASRARNGGEALWERGRRSVCGASLYRVVFSHTPMC